MSVVGRAAHWPGLGNHFCSTVKGWLTPVRSPQSNGMAESFVKTIKRDYVAHMPKPDRETALRNLTIAFEHYNEEHPHSALNYRSPREFRRLASASI